MAEANRFAGPRRLALSGLALAHAMLGEADAAAQALAERATVPAFGFRGPEQLLADAWTAHRIAAAGGGDGPIPGRRHAGCFDRAPDHRVLDLAQPDAHQRAGRLGPPARSSESAAAPAWPSPGEQLMTPEQITLVQSSFERLGPGLSAMATRFYRELFGRDPALRPLFTTDLAQQEAKFAEKLTEIVQAMPRLDELLTHTRALGARHVARVRAADYQTVGAALLAALSAVLGDSFGAPTCEAWTPAYNLVAETMLEGAAAARPVGS